MQSAAGVRGPITRRGVGTKLRPRIKPGDFVIIGAAITMAVASAIPAMRKSRRRQKALVTRRVEDTKPDGTKELVHTFGWYMAQFVTGAKAKGATVILCSPIPHRQHWETERDFVNVAHWDWPWRKITARSTLISPW